MKFLSISTKVESSRWVSLDISAAFDMVNHNLLLNRLDEEFRIIGAAKDWIEFYLIPSTVGLKEYAI